MFACVRGEGGFFFRYNCFKVLFSSTISMVVNSFPSPLRFFLSQNISVLAVNLKTALNTLSVYIYRQASGKNFNVSREKRNIQSSLYFSFHFLPFSLGFHSEHSVIHSIFSRVSMCVYVCMCAYSKRKRYMLDEMCG